MQKLWLCCRWMRLKLPELCVAPASLGISETSTLGFFWSENPCISLEDKIDFYEEVGRTSMKHVLRTKKHQAHLPTLTGHANHTKLCIKINETTFALVASIPYACIRNLFLNVMAVNLDLLYRQFKSRFFPSSCLHLTLYFTVCAFEEDCHKHTVPLVRDCIPHFLSSFFAPVPSSIKYPKTEWPELCVVSRAFASALYNSINNFLSLLVKHLLILWLVLFKMKHFRC